MPSIAWSPINADNYSPWTNRKEWIVVHNTANGQSYEGMAANNINYFKSPGRKASASYFIDDGPVIHQAVSDEHSAWHCGEATSRNGATNYNSFVTKNEKDNLRYLVTRLMSQFGIDADHVVRHHDVTGKNCPWLYSDDARWAELKSYITTKEAPVEDKTGFVQLWTSNGADSQKWNETNWKGKYCMLRVKASAKYLDVEGAVYKAGTRVIAYRYNGYDNQLWEVIDRGNGMVSIHPKNAPHLCLDVKGGAGNDGDGTILYGWKNQRNQLWHRCVNADGTCTYVTALDRKAALDVYRGGL